MVLGQADRSQTTGSPIDRAFLHSATMPLSFRHAVLPNGLTIIAEVDPAAHTAAAGFYVKTGARDEDASLMGVSHFLEHMMFKGTARRTADEVNQHFDNIGANYNAFTSHEMTAFWAHVLPEHLDEAEDILADILRPALRQSDFDLEKNVILEEIAMYADQPFWVLYEQAMERYYPDHPLRHRVLGTPETISALPRDAMQRYFDDRYSPDNMVVALAGRLDFDARVASLERRCGSWRRTGARREYRPIRFGEGALDRTSDKVNRHYLLMIAPAPSLRDDDRYAAMMLAQVLGDSEGSRLYWALIETGLAEEAQAQYDGRDDTGELYVFATCSPEDAVEVERVVLKEVDGLVASLTEDDLQRVRSKIATGVTVAGERPAGRMKRLGHMWTTQGQYRSLEDELARINMVTLDDLRRVASKHPLTPRLTARLSPAG
ncbi:MAG: insulinase family protein [Phycisphaeraceae bacterium]|nr:MAG: insulinase family protein [Phycisphaeraceae bacterium]